MACREIAYKNGPIVQLFDSGLCPDDPRIGRYGKHAHVVGSVGNAVVYSEGELKSVLKETGVNRGPAIWLWRNSPACY